MLDDNSRERGIKEKKPIAVRTYSEYCYKRFETGLIQAKRDG